MIDFMVKKNTFLHNTEGITGKLELLFDKPAAGGTVHYIVKCAPEVREAIRKNGDVVCLKWAKYKVRDRYRMLTCFHCQRHGHLEKDCHSKKAGESVVCGKCSGNHRTVECVSETSKCINC